MDRLTSTFSGLDPLRRLIAIAAAVGVFGAILLLAQGANAPRMALLYSGLDPSAAGEVITALDREGAPYDVRGNAIYVPQADRDRLRMALAAEGTPSLGNGGYEILDDLSGFGTTAQMFDAAFRRATEGELARTIIASPHIRTARVHIAVPASRPFARDTAATASVFVTAEGGALPAAHARALRYLVASAVEGLTPDSVTVIDSVAGLIDAGDGDGHAITSGSDQAEALKENVQRLLEARVGVGRAIVEVNVETVTDREQITERLFDPDSRVAISTVTEENSSSAQDARDGSVTVSGNLPDGDGEGSGAQSSSSESATREQINYEVSETQREILRAPGAVKRLSVAVLVDGIRETDANGEVTWTERSEEELAALAELAKFAVGFDEARGDVITLQSMRFPAAGEDLGSTAPRAGLLERLGFDAMKLVQIGVLAVVALILGLFVVRPILAPSNPPAIADASRSMEGLPAPSDGITDGDGDAETRQANALPRPEQDRQQEPVAQLKELTDGRSSEAADVLRSWMDDREATA